MEASGVTARTVERAGARVAVGVRVQLGLLVAASFLVRVFASAGHATARLFPDEYIYASLGRSLAEHGDLTIRGGPAHFPAILEPLVAAPIWALSSLETAYRLVQVENALLMSLAAVPMYLLARKLGLGHGYALLCGAFAVAIPDLVFSAYITAGSLAYALALAAVYVGVLALERPSLRREVVFAVLAALAVLARLEYVALFPGFAMSAVALERRRVLRAHPLLGAAFGGAILAVAVSPARLLGYYSAVVHLRVSADTARWALVDLFLLAVASGVVLVPGAVAALLRPRGRTELAFSLLAGSVGAVILVEAALFASNGSDRFQERYLFMVLPLVPIAFGLGRRRGRLRLVPVAVGSALFLALSIDPLTGYAAYSGSSDSPSLGAFLQLEGWLGIGTGSLAVACAGALAAVVGVLVAVGRRGHYVAVIGAIAVVAAASVGASLHDLELSRAVSMNYSPSWVDDMHFRNVAAIQTSGEPAARAGLLEELFWNRSLTREFTLQGAPSTDAFAASSLTVANDGALSTTTGPLHLPFLFQGYAVSATFAGARLVAHEGTFGLWKPAPLPRLRVLATGRYSDGWLAWRGTVTVWPRAYQATRGVLSLTLSLPRDARAVRVRIAGRRLRLAPGQHVRLHFPIEGSEPDTLSFTTSGGWLASGLRQVSVRSTMPVFRPAASPLGT